MATVGDISDLRPSCAESWNSSVVTKENMKFGPKVSQGFSLKLLKRTIDIDTRTKVYIIMMIVFMVNSFIVVPLM